MQAASLDGAPALEHEHDQPEDHGDADGAGRGRDDREQSGQHGVVAFDQQERADRGDEEQRVAVDGAVQVPGVGVQSEEAQRHDRGGAAQAG